MRSDWVNSDQLIKSSEDTTMNSQRVAGRAPMPVQRRIDSSMHSSGGGFCVICGTVWPCSQAAARGGETKTLART